MFEFSPRNDALSFIKNLIKQEDRQRTLIEIERYLDTNSDESYLDSFTKSSLIELVLDSLVDAIEEQACIRVDILQEAIELMDNENILDNLNLKYYDLKIPGSLQYLSAKELTTKIPIIFDAKSHIFNANLKIAPSSEHINFRSNFYNLLLLEAHGKSSILGHQGVFVPQNLVGKPGIKKYYSFKIDQE